MGITIATPCPQHFEHLCLTRIRCHIFMDSLTIAIMKANMKMLKATFRQVRNLGAAMRWKTQVWVSVEGQIGILKPKRQCAP